MPQTPDWPGPRATFPAPRTGYKPRRDRVLVFPGGMAESLRFAATVRDPDAAIVGASSLENDGAAALYANWARLPFVTDPAFVPALAELLDREAIGSIYCPSFVAWTAIDECLPLIDGDVSLLNAPPAAAHRRLLAQVKVRAAAVLEQARNWTTEQVPAALDHTFLVGLLSAADGQAGQCNDEKVAALSLATLSAPEGDIVEIGSLAGKSALVLLLAARQAGIGPLLCVDPWQRGAARQSDADTMVQRTSDSVDWDAIFEQFETNLSNYAARDANYLRARSSDALQRYRAMPGRITTPSFGAVEYCGAIALLHIDGNHDHKSVKDDLLGWGRHLRPGAWVVIDDFEWRFADGPKAVGTWLLNEREDLVTRSFVAGGALFCEVAGPIDDC